MEGTGNMQTFTIGFTRKSAEAFFSALRRPGLRRIVDVRLNNTSQLAGYTKKDDLAFFLRELVGVDYVHEPTLAPSRELLQAYKRDGGDWDIFREKFLALMAERRIEETVSRDLIAGGCLLCSEPTADRCHRRLVLEYLEGKWGPMDVVHL